MKLEWTHGMLRQNTAFEELKVDTPYEELKVDTATFRMFSPSNQGEPWMLSCNITVLGKELAVSVMGDTRRDTVRAMNYALNKIIVDAPRDSGLLYLTKWALRNLNEVEHY